MSRELAGIFAISWTLFLLSLAEMVVSLSINPIPEVAFLAPVYLFLGIGIPFFLYAPFRFFSRRRIPAQSAWHSVSISVYLAISFGDMIAGIVGVFGADLIRNSVLKKYPSF
ncbi:hypothetical protein [Marinobacter sp.]|uniref:hypothetical protein n=1 Tax=Marinobacter sp. TaxID=50741 RepID=UPI00356A31D6